MPDCSIYFYYSAFGCNECAVIKLDRNGKEYIISAEGHIQHVSVGELDGNVGTFEGQIIPFTDDQYFKAIPHRKVGAILPEVI